MVWLARGFAGVVNNPRRAIPCVFRSSGKPSENFHSLVFSICSNHQQQKRTRLWEDYKALEDTMKEDYNQGAPGHGNQENNYVETGAPFDNLLQSPALSVRARVNAGSARRVRGEAAPFNDQAHTPAQQRHFGENPRTPVSAVHARGIPGSAVRAHHARGTPNLANLSQYVPRAFTTSTPLHPDPNVAMKQLENEGKQLENEGKALDNDVAMKQLDHEGLSLLCGAYMSSHKKAPPQANVPPSPNPTANIPLFPGIPMDEATLPTELDYDLEVDSSKPAATPNNVHEEVLVCVRDQDGIILASALKDLTAPVDLKQANSVAELFQRILAANPDDIVGTVDLSGSAWTPATLEVLRPVLVQCSGTVKNLFMSSVIDGIKPPEKARLSLAFFGEVFAGAPLKKLNMSHNAVGTSSIPCVAPLFSNELEYLDVANCGFDKEIAKALSKNLNVGSLRVLKMGRNQNLGIGGAKKVAKLLKECTYLETFCYEGCGPNDKGTAHLMQALAFLVQLLGRTTSLRVLKIADSTIVPHAVEGLTNSSFANLATVLQCSPRMEILDIGGCFLREKEYGSLGATMLASRLPGMPMLKNLDLSSNGFDNAGVAALATRLPSMLMLKNLDLSSNGFGNQGAAALHSALTQLPALTSVYLSGNAISPEAASLFVEEPIEGLSEFKVTLKHPFPESLPSAFEKIYEKTIEIESECESDSETESEGPAKESGSESESESEPEEESNGVVAPAAGVGGKNDAPMNASGGVATEATKGKVTKENDRIGAPMNASGGVATEATKGKVTKENVRIDAPMNASGGNEDISQEDLTILLDDYSRRAAEEKGKEPQGHFKYQVGDHGVKQAKQAYVLSINLDGTLKIKVCTGTGWILKPSVPKKDFKIFYYSSGSKFNTRQWKALLNEEQVSLPQVTRNDCKEVASYKESVAKHTEVTEELRGLGIDFPFFTGQPVKVQGSPAGGVVQDGGLRTKKDQKYSVIPEGESQTQSFSAAELTPLNTTSFTEEEWEHFMALATKIFT